MKTQHNPSAMTAARRPSMRAHGLTLMAMLVCGALMAGLAGLPARAHADPVVPGGSAGIRPGEWQWHFVESSPMGSKSFTSSHCVVAGSKPNLMMPGASAMACYSGESASPGSSRNQIVYTFSCRQASGPVVATSDGKYVVFVAVDGLTAHLHGNVVTTISGAASEQIVSSVAGGGRRTGDCQ